MFDFNETLNFTDKNWLTVEVKVKVNICDNVSKYGGCLRLAEVASNYACVIL